MTIALENVTKVFDKGKKVALDKITTTLPVGKITGVVGPDGAGKTTLMRLLVGLFVPTSGKLSILGIDPVTDLEALHQVVGYMPQSFGLYEDLTVEQNLNLYRDLQGGTGEDNFDRLLKFSGLKPFKERLAKDLSGGMKQKLGLIAALFKKPKVLVLDEPSVGVDPISRRELWKMILELKNEGVTIVWSTTDLSEAERCDHTLLLNQGKLLFEGNPQELTDSFSGRTYLIQNISVKKRVVLQRALECPSVIDARIQGDAVRLVMAKEQNPPALDLLQAGDGATIKPTAPRFEDVYIDLLGGFIPGRKIHSNLTAIGKETIEAKGLVKKFGDFKAVDDISFSVCQGEVFGLIGPNGAGKSTTFRMLLGLLKPTSGQALIEGVSMQTASSKARSLMGYMAQKFSLYDNLTVMQNLNFFSGVYPVEKKMRANAVNKMIESFELAPFSDETPNEIPLGFKQRLAMACALIHEPKVLFLDEPTSGTDPLTRREFWYHINALAEQGVTILLSTHFMEEAEYCDRIGLIFQGKLLAQDTPDGLKKRVETSELPNPSLEDAFIALCEQ